MHITVADVTFCNGPGTLTFKTAKQAYNSTWIALLKHGFVPVKTWLLIPCGTGFYAIIFLKCWTKLIWDLTFVYVSLCIFMRLKPYSLGVTQCSDVLSYSLVRFSTYNVVPKFSDRQVWGNNIEPDQTVPRGKPMLVKLQSNCSHYFRVSEF